MLRLIFMFLYFILISVPLACTLYLLASIISKLK